jgi:integrase
MAFLEKQFRHWTVRFTFNGKKYRAKIGSKQKAESVLQRVEDTLTDIRYGRLEIPPSVDAKAFIVSGGRMDDCVCRPLTLGEAIEQYFEVSRLAQTTERMYLNYCRRFASFAGNDIYLRDFSVEFYIQSRTDVVQAITLQKELIVLRALFNQADATFPECKIEGHKKANRFQSLNDSDDGRRTLLTPEEIQMLRHQVRVNGSELIADVVDFVVYTGVRRSEVTRTKREDIDWDKKRLVIRELKRTHGIETYRVLPIHPSLFDVLQKRKDRAVVFTDSVHTITSAFKAAVKGTRFDVKGLGLHAIRHSVASQLIDKGTPVTVVAELLGHATPMTTLNVYSHAFDKGLKEAVSLL